MAAPAVAPMTPAEFLIWEEAQPGKHEYSPSGIRAMSGASRAHVLITPNLAGLLFDRLRGRPCRFQDADTKLAVARTEAFYYPDGMVACPPNFVNDRTGAIDNPTVVFEVLSPGTQNRDLGEKMGAYFGIPSLREYVVIASEAPVVTVYERNGEDWVVRLAIGLDATTRLTSLEIDLPHGELFESVEFAPSAS